MWRLLLYSAALSVVLFRGAALECSPECHPDTGVCKADHGILSCECIGNWSGDDCSQFICATANPCLNGGVCAEYPDDSSRYLCACPLGFTGENCQYTTITREGSACYDIYCSHHGTCYEDTINKTAHCVCDNGYWGQWCEELETVQNPDPCEVADVQHCFDHGQCIYRNNTFQGYVCVCDPGWEIYQNCQDPTFDYCLDKPCGNNGTCVTLTEENSYRCECPPEFTGHNCSEPFSVCAANGHMCQNGGTCLPSEVGHYFTCSCPVGRSGRFCEGFTDPCAALVCENGGVCVPDSQPSVDGVYPSDGARCECPCTYGGDRCEIDRALDPCDLTPCQNGGTCSTHTTVDSTTYSCACRHGYTGQNCESVDYCAEAPCGTNSIACFSYDTTFLCVCKDGWGGRTCSFDVDECEVGDPCNGGSCVNTPGGYVCGCPLGRTGANCEVPTGCDGEGGGCANGGECKEEGEAVVCMCPRKWTGPRCETGVCREELDCSLKAGNDQCDPECFSPECGHDGSQGNCFTPRGEDPWANCSKADYCRSVYSNGRCNVECNVPECLYDAHDCIPKVACSTELEAYCLTVTENGVCEDECNTALCPYDYMDCDNERYAEGYLVLILFTDESRPFESPYRELFLDDLGEILRTRVIVVQTEELSIEDLQEQGYQLNLLPPIVFESGSLIYKLTLRLDNQYCREQCPDSANEAVAILQAYYSTGGTDIGPYGFADAYAEDEKPPDDEGSDGTPAASYIVPVVLVVVIAGVVLLVGVIIGKRRRTVRAKLWRPSSPTSTEGDQMSTQGERPSSTSASQPGAMVGTETASISHFDADDYIARGAKAAKMDNSTAPVRWTNVQVPVSSSPSPSTSRAETAAVVGQSGHDARRWNRLHYDALRNPELFQQLLDQYRAQNREVPDVNAPGPSGYTPLMLAVMKRPPVAGMDVSGVPFRGSSSSDSSGDSTVAEHTALIAWSNSRRMANRSSGGVPGHQNGHYFQPVDSTVPALISAGANIDAVNDMGHTALHLAAAYGQGEYVKKLLAAGADPNIQDSWGQSAVHAAIGASAEGAFLVLVNHPKTNLNLKCDGGLTPLMLAVKQCNQKLVRQLIKKNVDINTADSEGRTAVHWAAALNNLETLKLLIRQGPDTIKDQQDSQGQTPLFLACREGHVPCVRHLLDCFANATLLDSLDRSPRQIACERQHCDIVNLLTPSAHGPLHYQSQYQPQPHHLPAHIPPQFSFPPHPPHGFMYPDRRGMEYETALMQSAPVMAGGKPNQALLRLKQSSYGKQNGTTIAVSSPGTKDYNLSHFYLPPPSSSPGMRRHPSTTAQSLCDPVSSGLTTPTTDIPLRDLRAPDPYLTTQRHTSPPALTTSPNYTSAPPNVQQVDMQTPSSALGYALQPPPQGTPTVTSSGYMPWGHQQPPDYHHHTSPPSTSMLALPPFSQPQTLYTASSSLGDLNIASVVDSLAPLSSSINPQMSGTRKGVVEPPTSCFEGDDRVSLNDIEPTLLPSMTEELAASIAQTSTAGGYPTHDQLPSVGYGGPIPGTMAQSNGYSLSESTGLPTSSYYQTAYNCHDCTQSVPSSSFQATPTYNASQPPLPPSNGLTRPLQHLPMDPSLQGYPNSGTGVGNGGTPTICSPPQAASVGASHSPSSYYPSPPSVNEVPQPVAPPLSHHHADPPSLTPSPENREEPYQRDVDQIMTESFVIQPPAQHPADYTYMHYPHPLHQFVPHAPRSSSRLGTIV